MATAKARLSSRVSDYITNALRWSLTLDDSIKLTRKNIGIFPGRAGWSFLLVVSLLWLVGTNYENNLVMTLVFLLTSLFVVSILHTFSNFSGLTVRVIKSSPCFAGEDACFELSVERQNDQPYENIQFQWGDSAPVVFNLLEGRKQHINIYVPTRQRGWFKPGRLTVESYYPLGLLRAWVSLQVNCEALVYPAPLAGGPIPQAPASDGDDGSMTDQPGNEDFAGFRDYQPGASLRQVAWKQYARGAGLHLKDYAATVDRQTWLDWDMLAGLDRETRLSRLCHWALLAAQNNEMFGLRLPGIEIPPDRGEHHRDQVLKALALFENERPGDDKPELD